MKDTYLPKVDIENLVEQLVLEFKNERILNSRVNEDARGTVVAHIDGSRSKQEHQNENEKKYGQELETEFSESFECQLKFYLRS